MPPPAPHIESDDKNQRQSEHRDIAHPITAECREKIQKKVLEAYRQEKSSTPTQAVPPEKPEEVHSEQPTETHYEKPIPGAEPIGGDVDLS